MVRIPGFGCRVLDSGFGGSGFAFQFYADLVLGVQERAVEVVDVSLELHDDEVPLIQPELPRRLFSGAGFSNEEPPPQSRISPSIHRILK